MCLMIVHIYKMHIKEVNIESRVYNYNFDNLVKKINKIQRLKIF